MRKIYFIIGFTLLATLKTYSQNNFEIHFGLANPVSDFASGDINNETSGGAAIGFNIGLKYIYQLSENGLGSYVGLDFNYNNLTKDAEKDIKADIGVIPAYYSFYNYYNIPISVGLIYTFDASEKIGLFANAGMTLDFLKMSDFEIKSSTIRNTTEFDIATNIGFRIGGGILFNKKTSISIDYLGLGNHKVSGEMTLDGKLPKIVKFEQNTNILTITLGLNF